MTILEVLMVVCVLVGLYNYLLRPSTVKKVTKAEEDLELGEFNDRPENGFVTFIKFIGCILFLFGSLYIVIAIGLFVVRVIL